MNVINHDLFPTRISVYEPDHKITDDERDFIKTGITPSEYKQIEQDMNEVYKGEIE